MANFERAKKQQGVQGVEIGVTLAHLLASGSKPMALGELAKTAGLAPSKVHRYLVSLTRMRIVEQTSNGQYRLGSGALALGLSALNQLDIYQVAEKFMTQLYDDLGVGISAMIWGDGGPTVIRRIEPLDQIMVTTRIGSIVPIVPSAAGRLFAAFLPAHVVDKKLDAEFAGGRQFTSNAQPITRTDFRNILADVRQKGYATVHGDFLRGFDAIAVPIFNHESQIAMTISVVAPEGTIDLGEKSPQLLVLRRAGQDMSVRLGYDPGLVYRKHM